MTDKEASAHCRPIEATPFEAFYDGAWHGIDNVMVKDGSLFIQRNHQGSLTEDSIHGDKLRLRSRKANASDCEHFLKSGIDVCVLSANPLRASPDQEPQPLFSWRDARIISIKKNPHTTRCSCLFSVVFDKSTSRTGTNIRTLGRVAEVVSVESIAILQKLNCAPSDDGVYEWKNTEDCTSASKSKLLSEEFSSEVAWLTVLSSLRKMEFQIKVLNSRIVYCVVNSPRLLSDKETAIISFQICSEKLRAKIETLVLMDTKATSPERAVVEAEPVSCAGDSDSEVEILYDYTNLRHSKRRKIVPDRFVPLFRRGRCDESNINEGLSVHGDSSSGKVQFFSLKSKRRRRKNLLRPSECKQMIKNAMVNIHSELEKHFQPATQWTRSISADFVEETQDFKWSSDTDSDPAVDEHEELWKEMEYSLTTLSLLKKAQDLGSESVNDTRGISDKDGEQPCQHEYELDEQIGIICRLCKFICTEIRYVLPPFKTDGSVTLKEKRGPDERNWDWPYTFGLDSLNNSTSVRDTTLSEGLESAWSLIPDYNLKLHPHQKNAFEFIWRNIAGSLKPAEMDQFPDRTGGCVISHAPGSGKTLLVLSFLVSYLRLYPRSRPLILAPKSAIYTWLKEFEKWSVSIPVYQIHAIDSFKAGMVDCQLESFSTNNRKPSKKLMHIMDILTKLRQWHQNPSVLLMSYSSFFSLSQEDSKLDYRRCMAECLHGSPGILILDEGHNPRSSTSKLRRLLMKVKTEFRILLSGTLFQNNFQEYFNTLSLARPRFIRDVERKLDPYMINVLNRRGRRQKVSQNEKFARKLFMDKVGQRIESSCEDDRKQGFELLSRLTSMFVDTYEGEISNELPGLQIYTLLLTSTNFQQEILVKLTEIHRSFRHRRCPLEVELLITVGSIHPSLIRTITCANNFFDAGELEKIDKCKGDFKSGCKAKFVVDLVHKCALTEEKVLIFCHNIPPINFFVELFETVFGWRRGEEILVLQGDQELPVRAKVMDKFNAVSGGKCRVLLASTTACAEGISLTAASRVILVDSEWNHSKTRQAIARAFRPGQQKMVYVYRLLASGTWEEDKYDSSSWKAWLSKMIFMGQYINYPSSSQVEEINDEVLREMADEDQSKTFRMITKHEWTTN